MTRKVDDWAFTFLFSNFLLLQLYADMRETLSLILIEETKKIYLGVIAPAKFIQLFFVPKVDWSVQILLLYFRLIVHFESGVSISAFLNI